MTMLLVLGTILVLVSFLLVGMALPQKQVQATGGLGRSLAALEAMGHGDAAEEMTKELETPFSERVLAPFQGRALAIGRRLSGADNAERIYRRLELAGNPVGWTVDRVVSLKVIGAVGGLVGFLLFSFMLDLSLLMRVVFVAAGVLAGYMGPNMYLYQKGYDRQLQLAKELPDAIDLLTISVESGLAFDAAVQQVARNTDGPLAEEFARVLQEMQIGNGRSAALRALADRTNLEELRSFVSAMVQADAFGIPIAQVLRVQSSEMRTKRRQKAEEKAQQVPVKMTIPLIFCILPVLFVIVLGPAVISIMDSFG
ncbi:type II secretion system F family protein [Nocardioides sp. Y6]|uniref:Type II secretion system F family protein n=1 Tax=Nocardioides malaquae TaxID=2773426 RepID=A0ABR9RNX2_9ACTN|nr:type II secretion system F family protein [Nocardioides malaquae]MBE7323278.1 type II secretion system F family protein [Nocardioides malaquae]